MSAMWGDEPQHDTRTPLRQRRDWRPLRDALLILAAIIMLVALAGILIMHPGWSA